MMACVSVSAAAKVGCRATDEDGPTTANCVLPLRLAPNKNVTLTIDGDEGRVETGRITDGVRGHHRRRRFQERNDDQNDVAGSRTSFGSCYQWFKIKI
jgi:hypothetical protein